MNSSAKVVIPAHMRVFTKEVIMAERPSKKTMVSRGNTMPHAPVPMEFHT